MGPRARYLGNDVPKQAFTWQDPLPVADYAMINAQDEAQLKAKILASGLTGPELIRTAWASASTFRGTDMRGGPTARASVLPRRRTGPRTTRPNWRKCWRRWARCRPISTRRRRAAARCRWPI
jgi:catalase (peroxidase I)